jgi:hypothetical protein
MARLTAKSRNALPSKAFAIPGKRAYPIEDRGHAKAALGRSANKSPAVKAQVRAAVSREYPGLINRKGKG